MNPANHDDAVGIPDDAVGVFVLPAEVVYRSGVSGAARGARDVDGGSVLNRLVAVGEGSRLTHRASSRTGVDCLRLGLHASVNVSAEVALLLLR